MPAYHEWNTALIEHLLQGTAPGHVVALDVSDEALERVGTRRWGPRPGEHWRADFLAAVRGGAVTGGRVATSGLSGADPRGRPLGVAFLGVMVLAAADLTAGVPSAVHDSKYFRRLGELLGFSETRGRPPGLPAGAEEPLWQAWMAYLHARGLRGSARGGQGARRFMAYPLGQTSVPRVARPSGVPCVKFQGGVRARRGGAYLVGGPPSVSVAARCSSIALTVSRDDQTVFSLVITPGEPVPLPLDVPGNYQLTAVSSAGQSTRRVSVMTWEALRSATIRLDRGVGLETTAGRIQGARVVAP